MISQWQHLSTATSVNFVKTMTKIFVDDIFLQEQDQNKANPKKNMQTACQYF